MRQRSASVELDVYHVPATETWFGSLVSLASTLVRNFRTVEDSARDLDESWHYAKVERVLCQVNIESSNQKMVRTRSKLELLSRPAVEMPSATIEAALAHGLRTAWRIICCVWLLSSFDREG